MTKAEQLVTALLDHCGHCASDKIDPKELAMGRKVEREHTKVPAQATKIAKDHLKEPGNRRYYTRLKQAGLADELRK